MAVEAVSSVSFLTVPAGVSSSPFFGPSGCGKSTLLMMLGRPGGADGRPDYRRRHADERPRAPSIGVNGFQDSTLAPLEERRSTTCCSRSRVLKTGRFDAYRDWVRRGPARTGRPATILRNKKPHELSGRDAPARVVDLAAPLVYDPELLA